MNLSPHTAEQIAQLIQLLDEWIADESGYEESTWDELIQAIDLEDLLRVLPRKTAAQSVKTALEKRLSQG